MSERDIDELFRRFAILDAELKEIRKELAEVKQQSPSTAWYQKYGTNGSVAYNVTENKQWIPQWEERPDEN